MIKRIDLFMPPKGQFGVLEHFTRSLHEALKRANIESTLLTAEKDNPKPFLEHLVKHKPDFTLSFNGLLPDSEGRFLCELIKIPHVACLVDTANSFVSLSKSPLTIIACTDRNACDFFRNLKCENVFFLPHAVEESLETLAEGDKKEFEITFLGAIIDYEKIKNDWKEKYPSYICETLEAAADIVTAKTEITFHEALAESMRQRVWLAGIDLKTIDFVQVLDDLEFYIRGRDRIALLQSIKDVKVDVFTNKEQIKDWKRLLGSGHDNIIFHEAVKYNEALDIMKKSRIVLNSSPMFKDGSHERIFAAIASGSIVLTNESKYIRDIFGEDQGVIYYDLTNVEKINRDILTHLSDENKYIQAVKKGRQIVFKGHTWDHRVTSLLKNLEEILKKYEDLAKASTQ